MPVQSGKSRCQTRNLGTPQADRFRICSTFAWAMDRTLFGHQAAELQVVDQVNKAVALSPGSTEWSSSTGLGPTS